MWNSGSGGFGLVYLLGVDVLGVDILGVDALKLDVMALPLFNIRL